MSGVSGVSGVSGPAAGAPVLDVRDLRVGVTRGGRDLPVVRGVSFTVAAGETVALVGESGCGKSLTALSVAGLLPGGARTRGGQVVYSGREVTSLPERERRALRGSGIAMIYQDPAAALNPTMRIGAQIREALTAHRPGRGAGAGARSGGAGAGAGAGSGARGQGGDRGRTGVAARVLEVLAEVGLPRPERIARAYPHQISGGQRQRVMIAMALAPRPRVLIADEPTTALDATIQHQILTLVGELAAERRLAVLWITHDLGVVARLADRVLVMYAGRIVEDAPAVEIFAAPRHPYSAGLLASIPPARSAVRDPLPQIGGLPPDPAEPPPGCPFAPRCRHRRDRCDHDEPVLAAAAAGPDAGRAACWVPREEWT